MSVSNPSYRVRVGGWLKNRFSTDQRFLFLSMICGAICGVVAVSFHLCIEYAFHRTMVFADYLKDHSLVFLFPLVPALGGLIVGLASISFAKGSTGGGVPQIKVAYYQRFGVMPFFQGFWRYILCVISMGTGASLGREAPSMHICATVASSIGQWLGLAKKQIHLLVPIGMAAGLAGAFNTPIAAITYVFEELFEGSAKRGFGTLLIAVVIAAVVERGILGTEPMFQLSIRQFSSEPWMFICVPLGIFAGLIGHAFVIGMLKTRYFFRYKSKIPQWIRPVIGGFGIGILGICVYIGFGTHGVLSTGHLTLGAVLQEKYVWYVLLILLIGKFFGSILCYGTDCCGGIFAPSLFIGGVLGALLGNGIVPFCADSENVVSGCALLGMGALFAAVIRCPITSILIIFEMTRSYSIILPLMVGNMLAYFIACKLSPVSLDDRSLIQDGVSLKTHFAYQGSKEWQNLPVSTIATYEPVTLIETMLPVNAVLSVKEMPHHSYPIVNEHGDLRGIVLHRELVDWSKDLIQKALFEYVREQKVVVVYPNDSIRSVAMKMVSNEVEQVPVVGDISSSKLIGLVTLHDIARQQNAVEESV